MRIRSNLTDGTIYEAVRRRREASSPSPSLHSGGKTPGRPRRISPNRRLVRLVILLALVLILMREAANPAVYRNFFGALGAPLVAEPLPATLTEEQNGNVTAAEIPAKTDEKHGRVELVDPVVVRAEPLDGMVIELGKEGRNLLTRWLAKVRRYQRAEPSQSQDPAPNSASGEPAITPAPDLLNMLASAAAGSGLLDPQRVRTILGDPVELVKQSGNDLRRDLQTALDRQYLARVSDATIWTKDDSDAFFRWLEIASTDELRGLEDPVYVGFVSLLDQPAVYRGARVALRGNAVRAERQRAAENPFGIEDYWLVWIRPEDGSDRPVMGYARELPRSLADLTSTGVDEQGPMILIDGVFLRRHLYQSQKGSELAPVIVGRVRSLEISDTGVRDGGFPGEVPAESGPLSLSLGKVVALAAILGLGFTLIVARYTARSGSWRRDLRRRGLSNRVDFLDSPGNGKFDRESGGQDS